MQTQQSIKQKIGFFIQKYPWQPWWNEADDDIFDPKETRSSEFCTTSLSFDIILVGCCVGVAQKSYSGRNSLP